MTIVAVVVVQIVEAIFVRNVLFCTLVVRAYKGRAF